MAENKKKNVNKVVFLGESKVGKTSIIYRFIYDNFDEYRISTIGAESNQKSFIINDEEIIFELWDTAGQERFRGINSIFYKNAQVGVLVYDITSLNSFKELQKYWYNELIENSPKNISNLHLYIILYNIYDYSCCNCWK